MSSAGARVELKKKPSSLAIRVDVSGLTSSHPGSKKIAAVVPTLSEPRSSWRFEKVWPWLFAFLFASSLTLSIVSLTQDSSAWLSSDSDKTVSRAGWRRACLDRVEVIGNTRSVTPCRSEDVAASLETILGSKAQSLGLTLFYGSIAVWIFPIVVILCYSWFDATRGTCCHGFSISLLWFIGGVALLTTAFLLQSTVNDQELPVHPTRKSVSCLTDRGQEITVCTDVVSLTTCAVKCRRYGDGVVCPAFQSCILHERDATCEEDGVGCPLHIDWAMALSLTSSGLMIAMALLLAFGSWTVSKQL